MRNLNLVVKIVGEGNSEVVDDYSIICMHGGEGLEVLVDDKWIRTRMEMNSAREWYLVGTPYCGDLEYVQARIPE